MSKDEIIASQISTEMKYKHKKDNEGFELKEIESYCLGQYIQVQSNDVYKITQISRESTELIEQGIIFESKAPEYFYTKLEELKIEMLAKATENAKQRAGSMAKATGNEIGFVRSAEMGEFQITPVNFTEVSDCWGINDTDFLVKKVTAVVTVSFAIE